MVVRVFVSYSHEDEELRNEFEVHLAMLRRQGLIEVWNDRRLNAGDRLDWTINDELDRADIILLLISPNFLASDYCYKIEKGRALERHRANEARLISVILRPCDWQHTDLAEFVVTPRDGRPITRWPDRDEAFLDVIQSIRVALIDIGKTSGAKNTREWIEQVVDVQRKVPRSSNLRVRKEFSQADRDKFLLDAFDYMSKFFEGSLNELECRHKGFETRVRAVDGNTFTSSIYRNGSKAASCTIRFGGMTGSGISYSDGDDARTNSFNEQVTVGCDSQSLFLSPLGLPHTQTVDNRTKLTFEGAAEYYWELLLRPLQTEWQ